MIFKIELNLEEMAELAMTLSVAKGTISIMRDPDLTNGQHEMIRELTRRIDKQSALLALKAAQGIVKS